MRQSPPVDRVGGRPEGRKGRKPMDVRTVPFCDLCRRPVVDPAAGVIVYGSVTTADVGQQPGVILGGEQQVTCVCAPCLLAVARGRTGQAMNRVGSATWEIEGVGRVSRFNAAWLRLVSLRVYRDGRWVELGGRISELQVGERATATFRAGGVGSRATSELAVSRVE